MIIFKPVGSAENVENFRRLLAALGLSLEQGQDHAGPVHVIEIRLGTEGSSAEGRWSTLRAEERVSHWLRTALTDLPNGADIASAEQFGDMLLCGLEFFLPQVLREIHPEWIHESLDGFYPIVAQKTGEGEVEIFGLCIIITDQTLTPIHLRLQASTSSDEVSWLECRLAERGEHGMVRTPYGLMDRAMKRLYLLDLDPDRIDWVYKVTYGQRRPDARPAGTGDIQE